MSFYSSLLLSLAPVFFFCALVLPAIYFSRRSSRTKLSRIDELIAANDQVGYWQLLLSRRILGSLSGLIYVAYLTLPSLIDGDHQLSQVPFDQAWILTLCALSTLCLYGILSSVRQLSIGWTAAQDTGFGQKTLKNFNDLSDAEGNQTDAPFGPNGAVRKS